MQSRSAKWQVSVLSVCAALAPSLARGAEPAAAKAAAANAAAAPSSSAPAPGAAAPTPAQPSPEVLAEAKQRFDRGYELYDEGDYPLALIEFNRAYELVPNYKVLYNIGQVCIQLGKYADARRALEEYVQKGSDELPEERRAAVNKDLVMLGRRTAFLSIGANIEGAEILVDELAVGKTPLGSALLMDAGMHRVTLRRTGYLPKTESVTLAGGDNQAIDVMLELQPEEKQTIVVREREVVDDSAQTWMIAGWATTGALVAGAIVTGVMGKNEADELKQLRAANITDNEDLPGRIDDTKKNASTLFLASDVMSGAALIVGGLSLWITLDPPEPERAAAPGEAPKPKAPEAVQVGYADGQLRLRGSF
jgi:tetratricopeptide (TPR) repeat protein